MRSSVFLALLALPVLAAATPATLNHQGRIFDVGGNPLTGTHDLHVQLFDAPSGGGQLWSEDAVGVVFDRGYYSIDMGQSTPLDLDLLQQTTELWMSLTVDDGPSLPQRLPLQSVPYALVAARADVATSVQGGPVDATTLTINGAEVVAADGSIAWSNIVGAPQQLNELNCTSTGQIAEWNGSDWGCVAPNAHDHSADQITSGTFSLDLLPIGTSPNTIARGDHTHTALDVDLGPLAADNPLNHPRYTDAEAISAVGPHYTDTQARAAVGAHYTDNDAVLAVGPHTARYTDTEAIAAVGPHYTDTMAIAAVGPHTPAYTDTMAIAAVGPHTTRYTDAEAKTAVGPHTPAYTDTMAIAAVGPHTTRYTDAEAKTAVGPHTVDTTLSEGTVETFVTNGPLDLDAATTIGTKTISTGAHYTNAEAIAAVEGEPALALTGKVGVGVSSPQVPLDVAGEIRTTGGITSQGNQVQRDILTWSTTANNGTPIHIKTNIKVRSNVMFRLQVEGYNYGSAAAINSDTVGYPYSLWTCTGNIQNNNYASGAAISHYCSSDGFIVVKLTAGNFYYAGFTLSAFMVNPAGKAFDVTGTVFQQVPNL